MPFPDVPCAACPRPASAGPCLAMQVRNPRYCHHAEAGHAGYLALLRGDPPPAPPAPPPTTVPVPESLRRLKLARACEHRADPQCGCAGWATCLLGKGKDGQVALSDCVECVAGRDTE